MKTDKEFLEDARRFKIATAKALSTMLREAPGLVKFFDWRGFDFRDLDLRDCDFSGACLVGSVFHAANLENARFQGADLTGAEFYPGGAVDEVEGLKALSKTLIANIEGRDKEIAELLRPGIDRILTVQRDEEARDNAVRCLPNSDGLDGFRKAREMDAETIASLRAEVAALSKNDETLKDAIIRINSLHEIIEARDKEIAELKEIASGRRDADRVAQLGRDLADRDKTIQRLIGARDQVEAALDSKDELIASLRAELADADRRIRKLVVEDEQHEKSIADSDHEIAELRAEVEKLRLRRALSPGDLDPKAVAAPGSVLIKLERSADPLKMRDDQTVGRIYDAAGNHYAPGFGVKAVVVGRSGSDVLREMSENWSRAGFME